ncbi:MAG: hypothetical protein J6T45_01245, partial [Fibrobacterales bacterium]|nr:hypothetical protein [Fibrobacterales bacterium]
EAQAPAAAPAEQAPVQSSRPALAPRGGDRQAEAASAAPAAEVPSAAPVAEAAPAEVHFGRRQQVKRPPELGQN